MKPLHLICYGPRRGAETLPDLISANAPRFGAIVEVRYESEADPAGIGGARRVLVKDPGPTPVWERAEGLGVTRAGMSNSLRQFTMLRAGLAELAGEPDDDSLLMVRSDVHIHDRERFFRFLDAAAAKVTSGRRRFARLTVNSISPLSYTGHRLHGSDWLLLTTMGEARTLFCFDPSAFATGRYTPFEWRRKGDFCFGSLAAEELFTLAAYLPAEAAAHQDVNPYRIPWRAAICFLYDNCFFTPRAAGAGLAKWEYLYSPKPRLPHPFGGGPAGAVRRWGAWLLFWSALAPSSSRGFTLKLLLKALLSWTANLLLLLFRSWKPAPMRRRRDAPQSL